MTNSQTGPHPLLPDEVESFHRVGFVSVDRPVLNIADLTEAGRLVDELIQARELLSKLVFSRRAHDTRVIEILSAQWLVPALRELSIISECRTFAAQLLATDRVICHLDHVIVKLPGARPVAWHQDSASAKITKRADRAVHVWVPLQDVSSSNGGLLFVPGSHLLGLSKHTKQHELGGTQWKLVNAPSPSSSIASAVKLGGVSLHTPLTVHSSHGNSSNALRRAWVLQFGAGRRSRFVARGHEAIGKWASRRVQIGP